MKFCQVVLLMTLGITGDLVMGAQTLPTDTVLVASEALPEGGLFLPDLLAGSGHDALLRGMALTPEISQAVVKPPAAPEPAPKLTRQDRLTLCQIGDPSARRVLVVGDSHAELDHVIRQLRPVD